MGVITDFFVASGKELREVLPNWLPVSPEAEVREVQNPFTGQMQRVKHWVPAAPPPDSNDVELASPNCSSVPHAEFKRIDQLKLATLNELLTGMNYLENMSQFERPVLLDPRLSYETGVHRFDAEFVSALANQNDIEPIAAEWAATEEMEADEFTVDDCVEVLQSLTQLARQAIADDRNLYYWWSL